MGRQEYFDTTGEQDQEFDGLMEEFKAVKGNNLVRTVRLKVYADCGCGPGTWVNVNRAVPVDSPLQDGDESTYEEGDTMID